MSEDSFATAINCMDGRTQLPVNQYMKDTCGVDHVDTITEPGPDGILCDQKDATLIESIRKRVEISVRKHGSKNVAIVAHHDCAGNPVDLRTHLDQIERAVELIHGWGLGCDVVALWLGEDFKVQIIDDAFKAKAGS
jgi:hypothetical protein